MSASIRSFLAAIALLCAACGRSPFALRFASVVDDVTVGCSEDLPGFGPSGADHIGINDLRFYVSDVVFRDAAGRDIDTTFDADEFQYSSSQGWVGLVDLTGTEGTCASAALGGGEGTARTHTAITGTTFVQDVATVSFVVGVPQPLMKEVVADYSAEGAPSPLAEMHWSWAGGHRHFVFNFTLNGGGAGGEGYIHVGSRSCGTAGGRVLSTQDTCDFINNPIVSLDDFDVERDVVGVDLRHLLQGVDFNVGGNPGVECHSSPMQPDCAVVFDSLGLNIDTGTASAPSNTVFARPHHH
ncbi:MAG: MbnP family copper-binding protein [Myxococcaceae bacterium]